VEPGESDGEAAVRETREEAGLAVRAVSTLGGRVHPDTGRMMFYIACQLVGGDAYAADRDEVAEVAWCDRSAFTACVPYPPYVPVQAYLDANLR
jgi:8-oxo-dGTP diphosphatase